MSVYVMQPKCTADQEKVYRFLYNIWLDEFYRSMEGMDHDNRMVKDVLDETARHFIAVDHTGRIVGCVRINRLSDRPLPDHLGCPLQSPALITLFGADHIGYASHFAVAPDFRSKTVASLLIGALYRFCLKEVGVEPVPIAAPTIGRETYFSIVYSFKRQVLDRAGKLDNQAAGFFATLGDLVRQPTTFAMTTVFVAHGVVR